MAQARILIVEDESIVVLDLEHRLTTLGYAVCACAASGKGAIQQAADRRPDLVLMDIRLRGEMDGIEAAKAIRARFDIPVVFLTALADEDSLKRAESAAPYGYVYKPFEDTELQSAIELALRQHKGREQNGKD
jgi:CheY-like chemotaxis protein